MFPKPAPPGLIFIKPQGRIIPTDERITEPLKKTIKLQRKMVEPRDKIIKTLRRMAKPHEIIEEPPEIIMELLKK